MGGFGLSHFVTWLLATTVLAETKCERGCDFSSYVQWFPVYLAWQPHQGLYFGTTDNCELWYSPPSPGTSAGVWRGRTNTYTCCKIPLQDTYGTFVVNGDCTVTEAWDMSAGTPTVGFITWVCHRVS